MQNKVCICQKLCIYESKFFSLWALYLENKKMANIIDFRFKVKNELDDKIFEVKIAWQTLVKDAIPTIKEKMATKYEQISNVIKLYIDDSRGLAKELESDNNIISK